MHPPKKKHLENTCYNFTLNCLAALSAAAVVAGAFIASAATHGAAAAITTKALFASTVASTGIASGAFGLTLGGLALLVAGVCLLPYLICRRMGAVVVSGLGLFGPGSLCRRDRVPVSTGGVYPSMHAYPFASVFPSHGHGDSDSHQPGGVFPQATHMAMIHRVLLPLIVIPIDNYR